MTYVTDPIGDLIARIRNAQHARKLYCRAQWSKMKEQLCVILKKEGWIADAQVIGEDPKKEIEVTFIEDKPALTLKRMSTPGRRVYTSAADMKPVLSGYGIAILTTSLGLLTDKEARQKHVGGEVLCTIS